MFGKPPLSRSGGSGFRLARPKGGGFAPAPGAEAQQQAAAWVWENKRRAARAIYRKGWEAPTIVHRGGTGRLPHGNGLAVQNILTVVQNILGQGAAGDKAGFPVKGKEHLLRGVG